MSMRQRAEGRGTAVSRGFNCCIDLYGSFICLLMHITDRFHSSYGFGWIRGATHMDLGASKFNRIFKILYTF